MFIVYNIIAVSCICQQYMMDCNKIITPAMYFMNGLRYVQPGSDGRTNNPVFKSREIKKALLAAVYAAYKDFIRFSGEGPDWYIQ